MFNDQDERFNKFLQIETFSQRYKNIKHCILRLFSVNFLVLVHLLVLLGIGSKYACKGFSCHEVKTIPMIHTSSPRAFSTDYSYTHLCSAASQSISSDFANHSAISLLALSTESLP